MRNVVIIGGGFAGLAAARKLAQAPVQVTLIDRTNHHLFQPLLYQVAMAGLSPADIAVPIRSIVNRQTNIRVVLAEATHIDLANKRVQTSAGEMTYDSLILAAGARNNYFGHDAWEKPAPGLKSIDDATNIRARVLLALEAAEQEKDEAAREKWLTFVVIGAGATGVELAGAVSELSRYIIDRDFRTLRRGQIKVILLEGGASVLPTFKSELRDSARSQLEALGVEVRLGAKVSSIDDSGVHYGATEGSVFLPAATVLWGAGVAAESIASTLGVPTDRAGRVVVNKDFSVQGYPDVFVVGDIAACTDANGVLVPGVAPGAMQAGKFVAQAIKNDAAGKPRGEFRYVNKGNLATIGRKAAVAQFGNVGFSGFSAWLLWMMVHILFLVGFRNRYAVMLQWMWHYLSFQRGARLITGGVLPHKQRVAAKQDAA
jgi:NADH:ubiquinone reductase (H+-translocating)